MRWEMRKETQKINQKCTDNSNFWIFAFIPEINVCYINGSLWFINRIVLERRIKSYVKRIKRLTSVVKRFFAKIIENLTAWKVSIFVVLLVRIFPYSDWIQTRKTTNTDTFLRRVYYDLGWPLWLILNVLLV